MEKYDNLAIVGEGSYGLVMKCKHRETGQLVAIKKFLETEDDHSVRKMALREIRMLKKLRHENLVNMIEVFRRKRRFYLVFEYMDHTVLDELEDHPSGLGHQICRQHIFQVLRGIEFCHHNNIVHRDVKPENVLVSCTGVIKLCDFGFARLLASPGETYTDYVATRWYRAPELLVGDTKYGREVDIWAIGCLFAEMMSGDPLFPGDSDIDQLFQIIKHMGKLSQRHQQLVAKNPMLKGLKRTGEDGMRSLYKLFPGWPHLALDLVSLCLKLDPALRPAAGELIRHPYFTYDRFSERFLPELRAKIQQEFQGNPLLRKFQSARPRNKPVEEPKVSVSRYQQRGSLMEPHRWRINLPGDVDRGQTVEPPKPAATRRRLSDSHESKEVVVETVSPTPYQSLETMQLNSLQVLHPSINNLSFNTQPSLRITESLKRSPQPLMARQSQSKTLQTMSVAPRPRKLERSMLDMGGLESPSGDKWFSSRRLSKPIKTCSDFSLPNVPGASVSPSKSIKKKLNPLTGPNPATASDTFISPRGNTSHSPSESPKARFNSNLPFV